MVSFLRLFSNFKYLKPMLLQTLFRDSKVYVLLISLYIAQIACNPFKLFLRGQSNFFHLSGLLYLKRLTLPWFLVLVFYSPASNIQRLPGITEISKKIDFKCVKFPKKWNFQIFTLNIYLVFCHSFLTLVFRQNVSEQIFLHMFHFRK